MFETNIPPPPYSSPSLWEGEEIGGGGYFEYLDFAPYHLKGTGQP